MTARLCMVVVSAMVVAGCSPGSADQDEAGNPVPPPAEGAYAGAYVDPDTYVESERIAAFEEFERRLGRPLDIFHTFHTWTDPFPAAAEIHFAERGTTPLISWAGTGVADILAGRHDDMIVERAQAVAGLGVPVMLRWRWEMNRPNLAAEIGNPVQYAAAWRHIHSLFETHGAVDVAWVWCPLAEPIADQDFSAYYPGDDVVDWICADGYARDPDKTWLDVFETFLAWASKVDKPILIGEFARSTDLGDPTSLARWLRQAAESIRDNPQIKALSYFNNPRGASGNYDLLPHDEATAAMSDWLNDPYFTVEER